MSGIEWTDRSDWNPARGCTRESEGCRNCYAEQIAARFSGPGQPFEGFAERTPAGGRWTGRVELIEDRLTLPLRWRKPARIFVNSAFDLFHPAVPDETIDRVFAVMALSPHHTFQVLTKRAKRMREYVGNLPNRDDLVAQSAMSFGVWKDADGTFDTVTHAVRMPLPNVWLGVSAEDQKRADERVPELLATPAAVRFVSAEPLLGPIDFNEIIPNPIAWNFKHGFDGLDWIIVGGESGPGARPMHPDWPRAIRDQCAAAGVAFFFKQFGEFAPDDDAPGAHTGMVRVGKKTAGRLLDGRTHDDMPARRA